MVGFFVRIGIDGWWLCMDMVRFLRVLCVVVVVVYLFLAVVVVVTVMYSS